MILITPQRYLEKRRKCNETWCRENPSDKELFVRGEKEEREGQRVTAKEEQRLKKKPKKEFLNVNIRDGNL